MLDPPKLKEFADDNFKLDENGRKFSKWVENTVGKGEIARYEQFLLFLKCFFLKRLALQTRKSQGLFGKGLKLYEGNHCNLAILLKSSVTSHTFCISITLSATTLVTSNFSFSYSVFKRLILQTLKIRVCLVKG